MLVKKLTITVDNDVHRGLKKKVGPRRISRFLNDLARPHVDDDDDLLTPDDVEADLDRILKDRMVAAEDEADEDDEESPVDDRGEALDGLQPKRADEMLCSSCFLLVRPNAPGCPVEDDNCPIFH